MLATPKSFASSANNRASQFMFPKYWIEYQNVKIDSEKCQNLKVRKVRKTNIKTVVLKENEKKKTLK